MLSYARLFLVKVAPLEGLVQALQRDALDDVDGVDDVSERLGHLAAVGVPDHRVQIHLLEGNLACAGNTYK
eukprot:scaffold460966_cov35-Prasinocladus_malaysianus.AAC.1